MSRALLTPTLPAESDASLAKEGEPLFETEAVFHDFMGSERFLLSGSEVRSHCRKALITILLRNCFGRPLLEKGEIEMVSRMHWPRVDCENLQPSRRSRNNQLSRQSTQARVVSFFSG